MRQNCSDSIQSPLMEAIDFWDIPSFSLEVKQACINAVKTRALIQGPFWLCRGGSRSWLIITRRCRCRGATACIWRQPLSQATSASDIRRDCEDSILLYCLLHCNTFCRSALFAAMTLSPPRKKSEWLLYRFRFCKVQIVRSFQQIKVKKTPLT